MKIDDSLKLSIIVPIYNVEKYLERCVDSLLHQDIGKSEYEIILINDGSMDKSYEIAKRFATKYDNIILLSQENKGQAVARNLGMDVAKGQYIIFVDSDDKLLPNVLGTILSTAINNRLDVCQYRMICFDSRGVIHDGGVQPFKPGMIYSGKYALTHGADIGSVCSSMFLREMIVRCELKFLEGVYHEDVDFSMRICAYAKRMMYVDYKVYSYSWNPNSTDRSINTSKKIKQFLDEFKIVRHIRDFSNQNNIDKEISNYYMRHGNSLLVSNMLKLRKDSSLSFQNKQFLMENMKNLGLYPIKGTTLSWKTTLLVPVLNMIFFVIFFLNECDGKNICNHTHL